MPMPKPTAFNPARYARHLSLPGIGIEGQNKLAAARVLIVGLGGLGCPSSLYLTAAGVGTLGLADFDRVDASNLQRQILYTEQDIGEAKISVAAKALQARNSQLQIHQHTDGITAENAVGILSDYDLVLDGTDNFSTRHLINDAAYFAGIPLISASLFQFDAQIAIFHPAAGGHCYRCAFPVMPEPGEVPNCADAGVFGALPGTAGALQAMEAVKWITGVGEPLIGNMLCLDVLTQRSRRVRLTKRSDCPLCGDAPTILSPDPALYQLACDASEAPGQDEEISVAEAAQLANAHFLDVREDHELAICRIEGAAHIRLSELGDRLSEVPRDQPVVVFCHHGGRSLTAVRLLQNHDFTNARSMAGGIDQWAQQCDGSLPRY